MSPLRSRIAKLEPIHGPGLRCVSAMPYGQEDTGQQSEPMTPEEWERMHGPSTLDVANMTTEELREIARIRIEIDA